MSESETSVLEAGTPNAHAPEWRVRPIRKSVVGKRVHGSDVLAASGLEVVGKHERARRANPAMTYSPTPYDVVPSALGGLTAEFGMGSGGDPPAKPPGRHGAHAKSE